MNTITVRELKDFPDLSPAINVMKLQDRLNEVKDNTILGYAIRNAMDNHRPLKAIASNIYEAYLDNPPCILNIVGEEAIDLIKALYHK